ncbi:MAG: hypothetical protein LQ346_002251 [Caloplaca aetnensis]|nr:MAG: hypothetical protein LQ346_002251 [Caloplaca aetnensis]
MRFVFLSCFLALATFHTVAARTKSPKTTAVPAIRGVNSSIVQAALDFERSTWANGSVEDESFYRVPSNSSHLPAGTLLKLELYTNTSLYTLPPQTALSRILYQTKDFNGSLVPASAFIQWPYSPRVQPDNTFPVVAWAHGTSGVFPECAPSHLRNLLYQFTAPYPLVLQGYVVVAPDYAGQGVSRTAEGKPIIHQLYASQAAANDVFYAVEAAQSAFPSLSKEFVVMGHSQGGGAAWAAAERQAKTPVKGYLGAVAASPLLNFLETLQLGIAVLGKDAALASVAGTIAIVSRTITSIFADFDVGSILTPAGAQNLRLLSRIQGCNSVTRELFTSATVPFVRSDVLQNRYVNAFQDLVAVGGKEIAGPLLVLQGTGDTLLPIPITSKYVNQTSVVHPESAIDYITYAGAEHIPTVYTSQRDWLGWIEDRFAGKSVASGLRTVERRSALPPTNYQVDLNWFLQYQTERYEEA